MKKFNKRAVCKLLATLKRSELREFENFLAFRNRQNLVKMWRLLRTKHPDFKVSDEAVFQTVRPGLPVKDNVFRIWVVELYGLAKEYIAYLQFRNDKYLHNNTLALALLYRKEEKTYLKVQREAEKLYDKEQPKSTELFQYQFQMEDFNYQYTTLMHHRSATDSLQKAADSMDLSLLANKLKYLVVMRNRARITGEEYNYRLEKEILDYLSVQPHREEPIIYLYHLLVKLFKEIGDLAIFKDFTHYFDENKEKIDTSEARQLLTFATNLAYWNIQLGRMEYLAMRFSLIKIMVEQQLAIVNGRYPAYHFRNIIRAAILAGKTDWATNFLHKNIKWTSEEERENLGTFNRAFLHFAKKEYGLQLPFMHKMEAADYHFTDAHTKVFYRLLAIKTAYEQLGSQPKGMLLKNYKSLMNAFRLSTNRLTDISENFKLSCKNFHKALSLIFQWQYGNRGSKKVPLDKEIITLQPLVELPWLLGQINVNHTGT